MLIVTTGDSSNFDVLLFEILLFCFHMLMMPYVHSANISVKSPCVLHLVIKALSMYNNRWVEIPSFSFQETPIC